MSLNVNIIISSIILILASFVDGARDAGIRRPSEVSWWRWHIVKWVGFYMPLVYIIYVNFKGLNLLIVIFLAGLGWLAWQIGYKAGELFYRW